MTAALFYRHLILTSVLIAIVYGADTYTIYLDEHKYELNHNIQLNRPSSDDESSLILKASRFSYPELGRFKYTVKPPDNSIFDDYRIQATIKTFDMNGGIICPDELTINKTTGYGSLNFVYTIFKGCNVPLNFHIDQNNQDKNLIFDFKRTTTEKMNFDITLTVARKCYGDAYYNEFVCSNNYCIHQGFTCNNRDNCGDDSDESTIVCNKRMVVGLSVAGSIILIIIVSSCIYCACKRRAQRNTITGRVLISPTNNSYSGSGGVYPVQSTAPNPTYNTITPTNQGYQGATAVNPYQAAYPAPYQSAPPSEDLPPPYAPPYPAGPHKTGANHPPAFPQPPPPYPTK